MKSANNQQEELRKVMHAHVRVGNQTMVANIPVAYLHSSRAAVKGVSFESSPQRRPKAPLSWTPLGLSSEEAPEQRTQKEHPT